MCGICGAFQRKGPAPDPRAVGTMNDALVHRGPDEGGLGELGPAVMAMRRLSIIDLAGGSQPMSDPRTGISLVYNGEIYNHAELREDYRRHGYEFRTTCDTEVVLAALTLEGEEGLARLNGMYALSAWDPRSQCVLLARDPRGIKPLFYCLTGRQLLWSSELRSLCKHPAVSRELDPQALALYLCHEYVPTPRSILKDVRKLEPGTWLRVGTDSVARGTHRPAPFRAPVHPPSLPDAVAQFHEQMDDAVRRQLVADVPVGVFLSGGLDSSALAAAAVRSGSGKIQTFSIGFRDPSFDESAWARQVAAHLGTEHHEQILDERAALDLVPALGGLLDEPLGDASLLPTNLLCQFASATIKVALSGDGGDELFGGYPTYPAHRLASYYRMLGPVGPYLIAPLARRLPVSHKNFSFDFKAKRFVRGAHRPNPYRHLLWMGSFHPDRLHRILGEDLFQAVVDPWETAKARWDETGEGPQFDRARQLDQLTYLRDDLLPKTDRASMAHSLEVRVPFLDDRVVAWAESLPPDMRIRGMQTKVLMRWAMRERLPAEILHRPKKGFGVPMATWLRGPLRPLLEDLLSEEALRSEGLFRPEAATELVQAHLSQRRDERKRLWTLLAFRLWNSSR